MQCPEVSNADSRSECGAQPRTQRLDEVDKGGIDVDHLDGDVPSGFEPEGHVSDPIMRLDHAPRVRYQHIPPNSKGS